MTLLTQVQRTRGIFQREVGSLVEGMALDKGSGIKYPVGHNFGSLQLRYGRLGSIQCCCFVAN